MSDFRKRIKVELGDIQDIKVYDNRNIDMQIADEVVKAIHNIKCTDINEQTRTTEEEKAYQEHKKQRYEKEIKKPIWKNFKLKEER